MLPSRGTEAARLSIVQLVGDGRGGGHPSTVLGYFDAPSLTEQVHEVVTWLNPRETIGFNTASLAPVANYNRQGRAMAFTGPGIACDYLDVEGPLHDVLAAGRPSPSVRRPADRGVQGPRPSRTSARRREPRTASNCSWARTGPTRCPASGPSPAPTHWPMPTGCSPTSCPGRSAGRCRSEVVRGSTSLRWRRRLEAGDCFETAMRWAYRAALCSPDFLYHVELGRRPGR